MASRYQNNESKKVNDGRTVYRSKIYPEIPLRDGDIYVASETGDRLDSLANEYYGDASLWWIIATANNLHDAPFAMPDGTTLRVPVNYSEIVNNFRKL